MNRKPIVSGNFYPGTKSILEEELQKYIPTSKEKKKAKGIVVPHAGYIFSGKCAGKAYASIEIPNTVIILGVNHRGYGHPFAVDGHDKWDTPLGEVELHQGLREKLVKDSEIFSIDNIPSSNEHSLEVQVPFLRYLNPDVRILPITLSMADFERLKKAALEIVDLYQEEKDILIVASTDMSHYLSVDLAREKDNKAIKKIQALDTEGLFQTVVQDRISMCGVAATVVMLSAALEIGATKAEIIDYTNSGVVMGDYSRVVAYLSMIIH